MTLESIDKLLKMFWHLEDNSSQGFMFEQAIKLLTEEQQQVLVEKIKVNFPYAKFE